MIIALLSLGSILIFLAAIGILRFPDTLTRIAAVTKAAVLGNICFALAAIAHFRNLEVTLQMGLVILVVLIGSPFSSHLLARARMRNETCPQLILKRNDYDLKEP